MVNLTERAKWFWDAGGMAMFKGGHGDHIILQRLRPLTYKEFSEQAFGDGPVRFDDERYRYEFWVQGFGADLFWGIVCEGRLVIGPYPYSGVANLPDTPEEIVDV